jgi:hypothetical protein
MTKFLFYLFCLFSGFTFSQDEFSGRFMSVESSLMEWDSVRGQWLAESFKSMSFKKEIPARTFPEELTPQEVYSLVPEFRKQEIRNSVRLAQQNVGSQQEREAWRQIAVYTGSIDCKPVSARSYGDPHLKSFDGGSFSFQTVGEFVLTRSQAGHMEVQARQLPQSDNFSLNTAVAMNVAGDRLAIYAENNPNMDKNTNIRLNGEALYLDRSSTIHLPHGGSIVKNGKKSYVVNWPSGERVMVDESTTSNMNFLNLTIEILPCLEHRFEGVLGNTNGNINDDFITRNGRQPQDGFFRYATLGNSDANRVNANMEKQYLAFLTKEFAEDWRVTNETSLFEYNYGQNTLSYTDRSYPRVHLTLNDMPNRQQTQARKDCEAQGISGVDLQGCIYDRGFLNIPPTRRTEVKNRAEGVVLTKVEHPAREVKVEREVNSGTNSRPQPIYEPPVKETKKVSEPAPTQTTSEKETEVKSPEIPAVKTENKVHTTPKSVLKEEPKVTVKPSVKTSTGTSTKTVKTETTAPTPVAKPAVGVRKMK